MVDAAVGYQDPQSGQKFILLINQAICINGLVKHLLCPMQCCLNGVYIGKISKFLAETPSETTNAIELVHPFDATHPLIIPLPLSSVPSYFDVYSPSIADYENKDIPKIHLTAEESPWDPSTSEYSERETQMLDHVRSLRSEEYPCHSSKGTSTVFSYSMAYDATYVLDNNNLATALEAHIQISIVLIGKVRKPSIDPIV